MGFSSSTVEGSSHSLAGGYLYIPYEWEYQLTEEQGTPALPVTYRKFMMDAFTSDVAIYQPNDPYNCD